jgi:hypothetical protein
VAWAFDKVLETTPSRIVSLIPLHVDMILTQSKCGWLAEGVMNEPQVSAYFWFQRVCAIAGVRHYVDAYHYDVQEWKWATRLATCHGRVRKDIFDATLKSLSPMVVS